MLPFTRLKNAHRQLMRLLVLSGQRSAALEQYQMCKSRLLDELGVEPGVKTQALYEQIRQGTPLVAPSSATFVGDSDSVQAPPSHNLPEPLTSFIGREDETGQLTRCLSNPICRLITLIGPPGAGKTRLAVHVAKATLERFTDGIWFIPSETVHPAGGLMPAIAKTIGFGGDGQTVRSALLQYLQSKKMLILLDGFEQLKQGSGSLLEVLGRAPDVKIMITSRERLNYQVACIFEIGGLAYPNGLFQKHADEYPAIRLFLNRALHRPGQMALPTKDLYEVIKICQLLEGLPLAVELAAASAHKFSYAQIAEEIQNNLDMLKTSMLDVPERHQSMHAAINQSWHLLTEKEKTFFARLSIFEESFSFEAAAFITNIDAGTLANLMDKSLVTMNEARRYKLQLILRNFAAEKLQAQPEETQNLQTRFSQYYMAFLYQRKAEPDKQLPLHAFREIVPEMANIQTAWGWVTARQDFEGIAKGLETLWDFFNFHDALKDGEEAFRTCVTALQASSLPDAGKWLGKALSGLAWFLARQGEYDAASAYYLQSIGCFEAYQSYAELVFPHFGNGFVAYQLGEYVKARESFKASASAGEKAGETNWSAMARVYLALLRELTGEPPDAEKELLEILMVFERMSNLHGRLRTLKHLGDVAHARGHLTQATAYYSRTVELAEEIGQVGMLAPIQLKLGTIVGEQGDYSRAKEVLENCLRAFEYVADQKDVAFTYRELGSIAALQDRFQEAHQYFRRALELAVATGQRPLMLDVLSGIACMFAKTQRLETAWELLGLIQTHPATLPLTLRRISALLQTCQDSPNVQGQEAAKKRGGALKLESVVAEFRLLL
ncbi:MAG: tetratricopeptide repeat protein [Anaerolineales bacterium]|nr:tetratricopeptide repeat protein [Anaerolineales bacterium]